MIKTSYANEAESVAITRRRTARTQICREPGSGRKDSPLIRGASTLLICLALLAPMACKGGQSTNGKNGAGTGGNSTGSTGGTTNGTTNGGSNNATSQGDVIKDADRVNGIISRDVYQVFVTAFGSTRSEAMEKGLREGQAKALNLMRKDPVLRGRRLADRSVRELRRLVASNAKVVKLRKEPNGTWSVVLHIGKDGLKSWLRRLE